MLSMRGSPALPLSATRGDAPAPALYTDEQRRRRDATRWTLVQGVLAPVQFAVMLASVVLVLRCLQTGEGLDWATGSVVLKTVLLYTIMVTGAIWEKVVFGQWLFAPAFFWEDVFSMAVIALHTAFLVALWTGTPGPQGRMLIALAAYAAYTINALQFLAKLRAARRDEARRRDALVVAGAGRVQPGEVAP